jgi:hypothetical protein
VYALTRQLTQSYTVQVIPEEAVMQQQSQFDALRRELGQASPEVLSAALSERDQVEPEPELKADVVARLQARLTTTPGDETASD